MATAEKVAADRIDLGEFPIHVGSIQAGTVHVHIGGDVVRDGSGGPDWFFRIGSLTREDMLMTGIELTIPYGQGQNIDVQPRLGEKLCTIDGPAVVTIEPPGALEWRPNIMNGSNLNGVLVPRIEGGQAVATFEADARMGDGVKHIRTTITVNVGPGEASALVVVPGDIIEVTFGPSLETQPPGDTLNMPGVETPVDLVADAAGEGFGAGIAE